MLTDLNDPHIIQIKKKQKHKMNKKREKKPTHTHTVGTAPKTKRKIVERCKIPLTLIHDYLYHGRNRRTRRKPPTCRQSLTNFIT